MKVINGISFSANTPDKVCDILASCIGTKRRIRVFYGDKKSGRDWHEVWGTIGYIGRSCGQVKIPLMIKNSRSMGGPAILDDCIVKITEDKKILYQHPNYNACVKRVGNEIIDTDTNQVIFVGKDEAKAERELQFFLGKRNSH